MQIPCVYLPGPAPAVTVANSNMYCFLNMYRFVAVLFCNVQMSAMLLQNVTALRVIVFV